MGLCSYSSETHAGSYLILDNNFINDYLPAAPDFCVKVYLYGLFLCSSPNSSVNSIENLMHTLQMTAGEVREAFEYLQAEGLVQILENTSTNDLSIKYLSVRKKAGNARKFTNKFTSFNSKIQSVIESRMITPSEFNEYYTLIESYHIDEDALVEIAKYCTKLKGSNVGYAYILTVAKNFASEGYKSTEAVIERLNEHEEVNSEVLNILKQFKASTKHSTVEERNLYIKWTSEFGFAHGVIKDVAKQISKKGGNIQKLDKTLTSYYGANLLTMQEINDYIAKREIYLSLAKEITRLLGIYYDNLDIVIETYILEWIQMGYDEDTLKTIASYCFKRSTKTLEGMNNCILKFYKLGLVSSASINQYIQELVDKDKEIQTLLTDLNLLRNVTSFDRDTYNTWTNIWNFSQDIIKLVSSYAKDKSGPIQYMNKILSGMYDQKISSIDEATNYLNANSSKYTSSSKRATDYSQRQYTEKDLETLFTSLDNIDI